MLRLSIEIDGRRHDLALPQGVLAAGAPAAPQEAVADPGCIGASVAGTLSLWQAADGAQVQAGEVIAVIEAMKMETSIEAPHAGRLTRLAAAGATLAHGAPLARIDADEG